MAFSSRKKVSAKGWADEGKKQICPECKKGILLPSKFKAGDVYCSNYRSGCKAGKGKPAANGGTIPECTTMSPEQAAGLEAVRGGGHVLVEALAGTGKTFWMVQSVRLLSQEMGLSVLCLAFARRDRAALTERVCGRATVLTSNAAGAGILRDHARASGFRIAGEPDTGLSRKILEQRLISDGLLAVDAEGRKAWKVGKGFAGAVCELVDKARNVLPLAASDPSLPAFPSNQDWIGLQDRFGVEWEPKETQQILFYADWLFVEMANLPNLAVWGTDFTGQIFLPSYHGLRPSQQYDRVLVDEAQDQSYATRRIAVLHVKPSGRLVAVGDRHQAIYGWRGADSAALEEMASVMQSHASAPERRPLTLCRRCSKKVIEQAQAIVPSITALPEAPEGEIGHLPSELSILKELIAKRKGLVLCRANAPAVSMCLKLLGCGVPSALVRSDVVRQITQLIDQCSGEQDSMETKSLLERCRQWRDGQLAKLAAKGQAGEKLAALVQDKYNTIEALADADSAPTAGGLKRKIDEMSPRYVRNKLGESVPTDDVEMAERAEAMVLFSTVHGAKGGEAEDVYLYSPPENKGKASLWDQIWSDPTDRDNVLYVALTRARKRLVFAGVPPTMKRFSNPETRKE